MKIIASDYDGTLNRGAVRVEDIEAIRRWRAAGNLFGMISGRTALHLMELMREHGAPFDFIIGLTGSIILDAEGSLLDEQLGGLDILPELIPLLLSGEDGVIRINTHLGTTQLHVRADGADALLSAFHGHGGDCDNLPLSAVCQLRGFSQISVLYEAEKRAGLVTQLINGRYSERLVCYQNDRWVNLVPAGSGKAEGIRRYLRLIGRTDAIVLPVGDNLNDLEMITQFDGCTLDTAVPEVIQAAHCVHASIADMIDAHID